MPYADGQTAAGLGARAEADLVRLAFLLQGDAADAEDLVRTALATVGSRRRVADPLGLARTVLVRRALRRARSGRAATSGWVAADPWDPDDDLRRALDALPATTRAAVVLTVTARLPVADAGAVLRLPEDAVRREVAIGTAALRAAGSPAAAAWRPAAPEPPADPDAALREDLARLAEAARRAPVSAEDVAREVASRRRRRAGAALAACALAALVVPVLRGPDPAGQVPAPGGSAQQATRVDLAALPVRGSLAGDRDFLEGLARQPWVADDPAGPRVPSPPAPGTARALFAGDVPGGRWALLVARRKHDDDRPDAPAEKPLVTWFTGPAGAAPEEMALATVPYPLVPGTSPALVDPRSGTLVVVGAPGDVVEVSARADVDAQGGSSRSWSTARTTDGVSVARIEPMDLPWTWSVAYRVLRDGLVLPPAPPDGVRTGSSAGLPPLGVEYPGGPPSADGRQAAEWAAFTAAATVGLAPEDAEISARLVAPAPAPAEGALALVTVSLPSGALLVSVQWARALPDGQPGGADCGMDVRPAGPPPEQRVLAAGCHLFAPAEDRQLDSVLLVSAPASVARVRAYGSDGAFLAEHELVDGQLVVPMPVGTRTVEGITGSGVLLGRIALLGRWTPSGG